MAKLKVAEVVEKTTKGGKPYLNIKSSTGKYYTVWQENQFIWHLFQPNAELDVTVVTNGAFSNITGVIGLEGENAVGTNFEPTGGIPAGAPNAMTWIVEQVKEMNKKLDWLIEERKTLGLPEERIDICKDCKHDIGNHDPLRHACYGGKNCKCEMFHKPKEQEEPSMRKMGDMVEGKYFITRENEYGDDEIVLIKKKEEKLPNLSDLPEHNLD